MSLTISLNHHVIDLVNYIVIIVIDKPSKSSKIALWQVVNRGNQVA